MSKKVWLTNMPKRTRRNPDHVQKHNTPTLDNEVIASQLKAFQLLNQTNGTALAGVPDFGLTVHPLGGAIMNTVCDTYGRVYEYRNLFVADGSLIPGSTACVNPSLTIAALAERAMDRFLNSINKYKKS
jgi:cholesterol oxidase